MPRPFILLVSLLVLSSRMALGDYHTGVRAWLHGDYVAAAAAFQGAAEAGEPESQYMMGRLYSLGDGVPRDFVQAWLWFDRAARQGHEGAATARAGIETILTPTQMAMAHELARPPTLSSPLPPAPQMATESGARAVVLVPRQGTVVMQSPEQQQAAR